MSDSTTPPSTLHLPPDATLQGYDFWAASYDATPNPMVAATAWALRTRPFDVAGCHVVEFGCGTGRHAPMMLAAGARSFTGLDGSAGMLREARVRHDAPRVRWTRGALHATPFATAAFDRVLVVLVIEHVFDLAPMFAEAARVLSPGGQLRLLDIHPDLLALGTNAHFHVAGVEHRFTSAAHRVDTIERTLQESGLEVLQRHEPIAQGELLALVPRLAKHDGRRVVLDLLAKRSTPA